MFQIVGLKGGFLEYNPWNIKICGSESDSSNFSAFLFVAENLSNDYSIQF